MKPRAFCCLRPADGSRRALRVVGWLLAVSCLVAAASPAAGARSTFRASVGYAVQHVDPASAGPGTAHRLEGLLEFDGDAGPLALSVTAEPRLPLAGDGTGASDRFSAGLTEAYVAYRGPGADVQAGRVRLPLETARLSVPYGLETRDASGRRFGLDGARADLYLQGRRLRVAVVDVEGLWTPVLSVRQQATGWEATLHAVVQDGKAVGGAAASGLVGSVVVYGEAWAVPDEDGSRYALGATGYAGDVLWTAEAARAPFPVPLAPTPVSFVSAQVDYSPVLGLALTLGGAVTLDDDPVALLSAGGVYELVAGRADLELSVARVEGPSEVETTQAEAALRLYL